MWAALLYDLRSCIEYNGGSEQSPRVHRPLLPDCGQVANCLTLPPPWRTVPRQTASQNRHCPLKLLLARYFATEIRGVTNTPLLVKR